MGGLGYEFEGRFRIINDTQIDNELYIYSDDKKPLSVTIKRGNTIAITLKTQKFIINKENINEVYF